MIPLFNVPAHDTNEQNLIDVCHTIDSIAYINNIMIMFTSSDSDITITVKSINDADILISTMSNTFEVVKEISMFNYIIGDHYLNDQVIIISIVITPVI